MKQFHVSQDGSPAGDGSEDHPWSSLEQARDALRRLAAAGESTAGATVWINGGDYKRLAPFVLDARDGGSEGAPITYRARPCTKVRLVGGAVISGFKPVRDPAVLWRLPPKARSNVVMLHLKAAGIRDFATAPQLELFFNATPMTLAIWPKLENPGDFWVDRVSGALYCWPPGLLEGAEVRVSVLGEPLIRVDGARHLVIRDLILAGGRADGAEIL